MQCYPAIDLRGGQVVRLLQGDFAKESQYSCDAVELAQVYADAGATWLHVVDLDGAKSAAENQFNLRIIERIVRETKLRVQTGGGIRDADEVARRFNAGCARIVLGSKAVRAPAEVASWLPRFSTANGGPGSEGFCIALDCKADAQNPYPERYWVYATGWQESLNVDVFDQLKSFAELGFVHALITDIARDGMLMGPNAPLYQQLNQFEPRMAVQASGGVSSLADLAALKAINSPGVVIGKALLEGRFTLQEALAC
jgi:phosphoribosylformimino-5-aminoimidazole carboxamide ribotide isomerase